MVILTAFLFTATGEMEAVASFTVIHVLEVEILPITLQPFKLCLGNRPGRVTNLSAGVRIVMSHYQSEIFPARARVIWILFLTSSGSSLILERDKSSSSRPFSRAAVVTSRCLFPFSFNPVLYQFFRFVLIIIHYMVFSGSHVFNPEVLHLESSSLEHRSIER